MTIAAAIDIATLHATCSEDAPDFPELARASSSNSADPPAAQRESRSGGSESKQEPQQEGKAEDPPARPCTPLWHGSARSLAFLLLAQAYFETRLAAHIHQGNCRIRLGECDGGKAASLWQLQHGPHLSKERWQRLQGDDLAATSLAAYEAARVLSRGRNHCGSQVGAVSLYATGSTCSWEPAKKRVAFSRRLSSRH